MQFIGFHRGLGLRLRFGGVLPDPFAISMMHFADNFGPAGIESVSFGDIIPAWAADRKRCAPTSHRMGMLGAAIGGPRAC